MGETGCEVISGAPTTLRVRDREGEGRYSGRVLFAAEDGKVATGQQLPGIVFFLLRAVAVCQCGKICKQRGKKNPIL